MAFRESDLGILGQNSKLLHLHIYWQSSGKFAMTPVDPSCLGSKLALC